MVGCGVRSQGGIDRQIRLIKIHYKTETEKKWVLIFWMRWDRDEIVLFFYAQDETKAKKFQRDQDKSESLRVFFYKTQTRTNF